jgi:hypothetical protein
MTSISMASPTSSLFSVPGSTGMARSHIQSKSAQKAVTVAVP